jgi:hypothetical protein
VPVPKRSVVVAELATVGEEGGPEARRLSEHVGRAG